MKQNTKTKRSHKGRKLVVLNRVWFWSLFRGDVVIINDKEQVFRVDENAIAGMNFYSAEKAKEKRYFSITPKMVSNFIEIRLNEKEAIKNKGRVEL